MTILSSIKAASLQARKDKNQAKAALLSTLISDVTMVGKNDGNRDPTDVETIAIIKKYIVNATETGETISKGFRLDAIDTMKMEQCKQEVKWLEEFLPRQMSVAELEQAVRNAIIELATINLVAPTVKDLGNVMKMLKERYGGQYDGQLASKFAKEKLSV